MKKLITFVILLFMSVALIYAAAHHIKKPLIVDGWIRARGNIYPLWHEMDDLGKRAHWFDSAFVAHPEFRDILLWGADSTDSSTWTPTKLMIDSVITLYWSATSAILNELIIETANDTVLCPDSVTGTLYSAFTIKSYRNQAAGETYAFRAFNFGTGAANTYGGLFRADSFGTGQKIGSYSHGIGGYTYNGTIYGAKNTAESWGTATPVMYGAYNYSAGCGVGKKYGAYNYGRGHSSSAGDSVFGAYNYGYGAGGTGKGIFGSYNNASGSAGDTCFGVYGKASGGDINWAGYFDGDVEINDGNLAVINATAGIDTGLYIKHYGARTTSYGMVFDIDTSENTEANVKGIDMSGSNAINSSSDHYIYFNAANFWRGDGVVFGSTFYGNYNQSGKDLTFGLESNHNMIFAWTVAGRKGDVIIRDGNLGVANPDFFQIQDSAGTDVVYQVSNTGNVAMDGGVNYAADAQSDDDYEVDIPSIDALVAGLTITFKANTLNTGAATLEITSVGDIDVIAKLKDQVLATGDILAGQIVTVVFDGSMWQMTSQLAQ